MSTLTLYAQPYDISAGGFFFESAEQFAARAAQCRGDFGSHVEEFEIQFIDGESIDADLARAWGLSQANYAGFIEAALEWCDEYKLRMIIAVGECGYSFDPDDPDPEQFEVNIYEVGSLRDLAEQFVDDGLYGEIPEHLAFYIDYEAIARDLAVDFSMITSGGRKYAYACR